jgi:catechol 2,3-dioxygenase-like lactoylglutathione lyase family enzyme
MSDPASAGIRFEGISPVFPVSDIASAVSFYCEALGFKLGWTWGEPPTHASVDRDQIDIMLTLNPVKAGSGDAYVGLKGVESYFAELKARRVPLGELSDRPYGMRDFAVRDPDGNRLVFGESTVD